jgi:hypothetical protein
LGRISELLGELQEPDLGANDLLFLCHGGLHPPRRDGALRHPAAPRPASVCDSPWGQDAICPIKFWLTHKIHQDRIFRYNLIRGSGLAPLRSQRIKPNSMRGPRNLNNSI